MPIKAVNQKNFESIISSQGIVMIDVWAEWCGACKTFNPIYERVAEKYSHHNFAKIDASYEKDLISSLEIENIPALLLYRDGILLFKQPGYYEEDKLEDIIHQAENLDMEEVKTHIEAQYE